MKICSFTRLWNERTRGHLERFLSHITKVVDTVCIYDDGSSDHSDELYKQYGAKVLYQAHEGLGHEQRHCAKLLNAILQTEQPDWILWIDGDTVMSKTAEKGGLHETARNADPTVDAYAFHNVNFWRDVPYCRMDNAYNDLWPICFWRVKPGLHFRPQYGLHGRLFPIGIQKVQRHSGHKLLHYGFASHSWIIGKYRTYEALGQMGKELCRLVDERGLQLSILPREWFPDDLWPDPTPPPPEPIIHPASGLMIPKAPTKEAHEYRLEG